MKIHIEPKSTLSLIPYKYRTYDKECVIGWMARQAGVDLIDKKHSNMDTIDNSSMRQVADALCQTFGVTIQQLCLLQRRNDAGDTVLVKRYLFEFGIVDTDQFDIKISAT